MNSLFKTITCSNHDNVDVVEFQQEQNLTQSIHITDLVIEMFIGVEDHEKSAKQRVVVNASFDISPDMMWQEDDLDSTVSYADIIGIIKNLAADGHVNLVETFAYQIIDECFKFSSKIKAVEIKIDKPDVIAEANSVGCSISKRR